jgi:DNA-binding GntR family transcriptional regulator
MALSSRLSLSSQRGGGEAVPELRKLHRATLNDEVYAELKRAIMAGAIEPGRAMTIRSLSAGFGVSLMPVREALGRLVAERILELLPNRSVTLPVMGRARFCEVTRIRVALEGMAAREGAGNVSGEDLAQMFAWNDEMESPEVFGSPRALDLNRQIHHMLYRAARMPMLYSMIETMWLQVGSLFSVHMRAIVDGRTDSVQHHHREAFTAIRDRDPERAAAAIMADIEASAAAISPALA